MTEQDHPTAPASPNKLITWRAVIVGSVLAAAWSALIPWVVAELLAPLLIKHFLPPLITVILLIFGVLINPLLGRLRFRGGELATICVMMLGISGIVSSGMLRFYPNAVTYPSKMAAELAIINNLKVSLDGVGHRISESDHKEGRWRWAFNNNLFLGFPEQGPINSADAEYRYVVDGVLSGLGGSSDNPVVSHRSTVTWTDTEGRQHELQALSGDTRLTAEPGTFIDIDDDPIGLALRGMRAGERGTVERGKAHHVAPGEDLATIIKRHYPDDPEALPLVARHNHLNPELTAPLPPGTQVLLPDLISVQAVTAPGVPWSDWIGVALAWSPLIIGILIAMICVAGITRKQWIENERLPYPIANVFVDLCQDNQSGRRFSPLFSNRIFWIGLAIPFIAILWHGLFSIGVLPIDFKMHYNFWLGDNAPFAGSPWDQAYSQRSFFQWRIIFSIIALAFFMTVEVGFSMWFFVVALNIIWLLCAIGGMPLTKAYVGRAATGGFGMMVLVILYIGRHYYWQLLKAAFSRSGDAAVRHATPYVWGLLGSVGLAYGFFLYIGADPMGALLLILLFLGHMLVVARIVAEAGIPSFQGANGNMLTHTVLAATGFSLPVTSLVPLTMIGMIFPISQQNAQAFAVTASYVADRKGLPQRRASAVFAWGVGLALFVGGAALIALLYLGDNAGSNYYANIRQYWIYGPLSRLSSQIGNTGSIDGQEQLSSMRMETWICYLVGAGLILTLSICRMRFARWPLHPIGLLLCWSWPVAAVWFSVFLGWFAKVMVMRYAGQKAYVALRPAAIGMIAGEALIIGTFVCMRIIAWAGDWEMNRIWVP